MNAHRTSNTGIFLVIFLWTGMVAAMGSHNEDLESLFPNYKLIKDIIESDPQLLFKLQQTFNPPSSYRYWQVNGVEVIPIGVNVSFLVQNDSEQMCTATDKGQQKASVYWDFQWTNSLLMNLICGDILLAMDPSLTSFLYSCIVQSHLTRKVYLDLHLNKSSFPCNQTLDDLQQALALFLSTSKAAIQEDSRNQGYISRRYTYYNYDFYFSKLAPDNGKRHLTTILTGLWVTFLLLNLMIPIFSITRGKQILTNTTVPPNKRLYRAMALAVILFNITYVLITIILHTCGLPTVLECHISTAIDHCRIPKTVTSYNYVIGILITKAVVLPIALMIELVAALIVAFNGINRPTTRELLAALLNTFVIWQLLVFIQITVGLVSIPVLVLTYISPASVLLSCGAIFLILMMITYIFATIPLLNSWISHTLHSCVSTIETLFITALLISTFHTNYTIVQNGISMDGVKGYIVSLAPTILISISLWFIKKKYFANTQLVDNPSTEELIRLSEDLDH